ncbi:hypothetical protein EI555_001152 [Monodon monoceros]|uniref:Bone marrow stromal antigen 2 n=1 Tax=Monodon monoceros TaxID=40151 RepID=A0A4V5PA86_MONMO|nr:hypothetical protein EI555_001152 [Monodon monoceros]
MVDHLNESVLHCLQAAAVPVLPAATALVIFAVRANSKHCTDGLQAEQECQNRTRYVQHQLTQAQEVLHKMEIQAATCNQMVVTLRDSLKTEQAQVAELQGVEILRGAASSCWSRLGSCLSCPDLYSRRGSEASAENNSSSCSSVLFAVVVVVVLEALLI